MMAKTKKFVNNNGENAVEEMLQGMVQLHPKQFKKLKGLNVIVRADFEQVKLEQVVLVSGGGSGHEPAHAGYCGHGMLTAAVCGNVFASPSVDSILNTIRTVTGPKGCLLIVKNYTGDRLNFGLAAEQAKAEGFNVEMVIVADDAALQVKGVTGRRGLAGTVLVHKVAGGVAASGADLVTVLEAAEEVAGVVRTVGCALSMCNVPGKKVSEARLTSSDGLMEVGLGIHGEPGKETMQLLSTNQVVEKLSDIILNDFEGVAKNVAVLLNNLGGTTPLEMYGITKSTIDHLSFKLGLNVVRVYMGPVMTSLEMAGFSLTILNLDGVKDKAAVLSQLDASSSAPGWPGSWCTFQIAPANEDVPVQQPRNIDDSQNGQGDTTSIVFSDEQAKELGLKMKKAAQSLVDEEPQITEWDKLCGDGDAGETFKQGAESVLRALDDGQFDLKHPAKTLETLCSLAKQMGGTSGAILAIFFSACEANLNRDSSDFGDALVNGCAAVTRYGGAEPGMRTMLDALDALARSWKLGDDFSTICAKTTQAANATAEMKASAGRSNYVPDEKLRGIPDPGAKAVAYAVNALLQ